MIVAALSEPNSTATNTRARVEPADTPDTPEPTEPARSFINRGKTPHRRDLTLEKVIAALQATGGARAAAAQRLGVTRSAITKFIQRHPQAALEAAEIAGTYADLAQGQLVKAVQNGEGWAIRYMLDNHGGDLGFGKKIMLQGDPAHPLHTKTEEAFDYSHLTLDEKVTMLELMRKARGAGGNAPSV